MGDDTLLTQSFRDLSFVQLSESQRLVIACDSSAAIGQKPADKVVVSPKLTAAFSARVAILELLCFGVEPLSIVDTIGNEYEPTGRLMIAGIQEEIVKAGLSTDCLNGSTEENMQTEMTTVGVTTIGVDNQLRSLPTISRGADILQVGDPLVGQEVAEQADYLVGYDLVRNLRKEVGVLDMVPVGSKGIGYEAELMAEMNMLSVIFESKVNLEKSAGPATVILLAVEKAHSASLMTAYPMLQKIGSFDR